MIKNKFKLIQKEPEKHPSQLLQQIFKALMVLLILEKVNNQILSYKGKNHTSQILLQRKKNKKKEKNIQKKNIISKEERMI